MIMINKLQALCHGDPAAPDDESVSTTAQVCRGRGNRAGTPVQKQCYSSDSIGSQDNILMPIRSRMDVPGSVS